MGAAAAFSRVHMQVTPAKKAANRENAKKSTGPKSLAGKARVRKNAFKHGLLSQGMIFKESDETEFDNILEDVTACWQPADHTELVLVHNLALDIWKGLTADRWEIRELENRQKPLTREMLSPLMEGEPDEVSMSVSGVLGRESLWDCKELLIDAGAGMQQDDRERPESSHRRFHIVASLTDRLDRLVRYGAAIRRDRDRCIAQLQRLKRRGASA